MEPYVQIAGARGVSMPLSAFQAAPHVNWRHVDGPLMSWAGRMHWLTRRERLKLWLGLDTIEGIAQRIWPQRREYGPDSLKGAI